MKLFDRTLTALENSLDARLTRQNVLAGDIANVDTPDYKPQNLSFAQALQSARLERQIHDGPSAMRPGDLPLGQPAPPELVSAESNEAGAAGIDGNRVDLDRTMASLAENALQYGASTRAAGKKLALLRFVASDGNG